MRCFLLVLVAALTAMSALADEKPACKAATAGQFWPAVANSSPKALQELARSGELEICARKVYRFKWQLVTVSAKVSRQAGTKDEAAPGKEPANER